MLLLCLLVCLSFSLCRYDAIFLYLSSDSSLSCETVGEMYRFRCKASNDLGSSNWSAWSWSSIALVVPSIPQSISIAADGPLGAEIDFRISYARPLETGSGDSAWPLLSYGISASRVYASNLLGGACKTMSDAVIVNATTLSGRIKALTTRCTYRIHVRAKNVIGWGPSSTSYDLIVKVNSLVCLLQLACSVSSN